jgi:hypothetical protein
MTPRRTLLEVEQLGDRILPSATLPLPAPPLAAPLAAPQKIQHPALAGHGQGQYTQELVPADFGGVFDLHGSANLAGLGQVTVTGRVNSVGFIHYGRAGGTLTFANARGSVTVQLSGPEQLGFSSLPQAFHYRVVGATGAFKGLTGQGTLQLVLHESPLPFPGAGMVTPHGTFALTI